MLFVAMPQGTLPAYSTSDFALLLTAAYVNNSMDLALSADGGLLVTSGSGRTDLWRVGK